MIRKLVVANLALLAVLLASAIVNAWTHGTVAQSILSSLQVTGTDPTLLSDSTNRVLVDINGTFTGSNIASGFSDGGATTLSMTSNASPGGLNNATDKTTWYPLSSLATYHASGQKFGNIINMKCYGMGDCGPTSINLSYAGGPVSGDEGSASVFQTTFQQQTLTTMTQSGASVQSSCNTTLTQNISRPTVSGGATSIPTQTVTVASTANCNVNDWLAIGDSTPSNNSLLEAVKITSVGGGTITAAFRLPHSSGDAVRGALVLNFALGVPDLGQDRVLVNLSGTTYTTGTVTGSGQSWTGTGSGTTWDPGGTKVGPVGGSTNNVGCIALTNDDYTGTPGAPFNGVTLKSWYQITSIISNTSLGIYSNSVAGDGSYRGNGVGAGAYMIKPCVRVLTINGSTQVVAENTSTTWSNGNNLELAITPYPDVTGAQYSIAKFNPGGTFRGWTSVTNSGVRKGAIALSIDAQHMTPSGVITNAGSGYTASGTYPLSGVGGVPVTGGAGSGMTAVVTVAGNVVTAFTVVTPGSGYNTGDILSVSNASVGGAGSGFQWTFNGSDSPIGWDTGAYLQGTNTGLSIPDANLQAIALGNTSTSSKISWNNTGTSITYNASNFGLTLTTVGSGQGGVLTASNNTSNTWSWLNYNGFIGTTPNTVSTLPTCDGTHAGMGRWVTDSTGTTYGSTVTPGGGSGKGQAMCDGTNWVLH